MRLDIAGIDITAHNRYLIYDMLGHRVAVSHSHGPRRKRTGVVEQVYRNIFDNLVEFTLSGQVYALDEPVAIVQHQGNVLFLYGDIDKRDLTDEELFAEMRDSADWGETVNDVLHRTKPNVIKTISFEMGPCVIKRGKTFRKAV